MNSRLVKELPELLENKVISEEVALKIENYFSSKTQDSPNKLFMVFGVLGSLLVGLGVILILAHNWDNFSKTIKTVFAFTPLIIGQLLVGYSILKKKSQVWKESSGVFLFFAVGASIALVSQIYNIPGNLSGYLLTWIVLCLPLMYLLKSNILAMLHLVFTTYYACNYGYFTGSKQPWLYFLLLGFVMPFYFNLLNERPKANITSIFNWLIPFSCVITLGAFIGNDNQLGFLMYVLFFGMVYNIGKLPFFENQKLRRNGYLVIGSLGTIISLLFATFEWFWDISFRVAVIDMHEFYISLVLFLITIALLIYMFSKKWIKVFNLFQYVFIIFSIIFLIGLSNSVIPTVLTNILILSLGLIAVKIGADRFHFGVLNYGLLIITGLIICRFFDTNISFVIRGLLFVTVGVGFFVTNYMMLKRQNSKDNNVLN
ncbi:MAG: DUF2157 domain-containing protein [Olleya sp.]